MSLPTLDDLLSTVKTPEARIRILSEAPSLGWHVDEKYDDEIIEFLAQKSPSKAANYALKKNHKFKALQLFEKSGNKRKTAQLAEELGQNDLAFKTYQALGDLNKSILLAKKIKKPELAKQLVYTRVNKLLDEHKKTGKTVLAESLQFAYQLGDKQLVYKIYDETENFYQGFFAATGNGDHDKAKEFIEKHITKSEKGSEENKFYHIGYVIEHHLSDKVRAKKYYQIDQIVRPKVSKEAKELGEKLELFFSDKPNHPRHPTAWYSKVFIEANQKDFSYSSLNSTEKNVFSHLKDMGLVTQRLEMK